MQVKRPLIIEPVGVAPESLPRPIDWRAMFGNDNPVELEIGCGKGTFITQQALARPETNFFGIEWANFYWQYTADRLRRNGCEKNARVVRADAKFFLRDYVAEASLAAVHIYFPDPWPKARHHKRRLITPAFVEQVVRVLAPGGRVQIVTDHADYWAQIEAAVRASPLEIVDYEAPLSAASGEVAGTNFERKYVVEGRAFFAIAGRAQAPSSNRPSSKPAPTSKLQITNPDAAL